MLNYGGRKKIFRGVVGKENVTICGGFTRRNQENSLKIYYTVILLGLAGYELIITNSAYGLVGYCCEARVASVAAVHNPNILVIVLTKAAPALVIKWRGEYFLKCLCIGNNRLFLPFLNQSGNFRTKIETFHYTQCIH